MTDTELDILTEISDENLSKLLTMYEEHREWIPHVYSTILTGIEWRKKKKERYTIFMSPDECWKEDGTFFMLLTYYSFDLFCFSLDDSGRNIYEGITKSKIFDAENCRDKGLVLYAVHDKFYPIVAKAVKDKGIQLDVVDHCYMFSIPREEALKFDIGWPTDVYIKKLDQSHVDTINSVWPHRYENSEKFISLLIEMNDCFGVFLKSTDELVSWILLSIMGQLGVLQTAEGHKRKGYACLITKYMSKYVALKGYSALGTIKMTDDEQDILEDISDEDLPKLAEIYEKHKDWAPYVYSMILTGIDWKKKKGKYMKFMSPNSCWREDGTFFVLLAYHSFDIFLFSLDDTGKNIYEGITKTKRLEVDGFKGRPPLLFNIHIKLYPIVVKAIEEKGIKMTVEMPCHMFSIPREEALKFKIECPPEVYIKKLDTSHAELVDLEWPHRYKDSVKFVSLLIEMNEGYGVFLKSSDELVSWTLLSMLGQLAHVQTVEGHKKKGYASIIVKYLSERIAKKGYSPFGTVLENNTASASMFQKLGFNNLGMSFYSIYDTQ